MTRLQGNYLKKRGACQYEIRAICDYTVIRDGEGDYGRLFYADIKEFEELPPFEIGEVELFDKLPENLTYPEIQPYLYHKVINYLNSK